MNIKPWAFQPNEKELQKQYYNRYLEIKHFKQYINYSKISWNGKNEYLGQVVGCSGILNELDIALILDDGNLCFGGTCDLKKDGKFKCVIYID